MQPEPEVEEEKVAKPKTGEGEEGEEGEEAQEEAEPEVDPEEEEK